MEKWEYHTSILWADVKNEGFEEYHKSHWPDWQPPKFAPQTMIPQLNRNGENGWELVSIQPVHVGHNSDIQIPTTSVAIWTNAYFCVFKRRVSETKGDGNG